MREFGEDWAEKLAAEFAASLGMPAASVDLGTRHGRRGALSNSVLPDGGYDLADYELVHGNELLQRLDPAYDKTQTREASGYTLDAVWEVLTPYGPLLASLTS